MLIKPHQSKISETVKASPKFSRPPIASKINNKENNAIKMHQSKVLSPMISPKSLVRAPLYGGAKKAGHET